jgi:hypothetical protein
MKGKSLSFASPVHWHSQERLPVPHGIGWPPAACWFIPAPKRAVSPVCSVRFLPLELVMQPSTLVAIFNESPVPLGAGREDTGTYQPTIDHETGGIQEKYPEPANCPNSTHCLDAESGDCVPDGLPPRTHVGRCSRDPFPNESCGRARCCEVRGGRICPVKRRPGRATFTIRPGMSNPGRMGMP